MPGQKKKKNIGFIWALEDFLTEDGVILLLLQHIIGKGVPFFLFIYFSFTLHLISMTLHHA